MKQDITTVLLTSAAAAAWVTGIANAIVTDSAGMLLLNLFIPPVGVLHGVLVWIGLA